jgi:hypothetical protein
LAYEINPGDNATPSVKTTALLLHSQDALYLAFRAEETNPAAIRAFLRDRDLYGEFTARPGQRMGMFYRHGRQVDLAASRTGTVDQIEPWVSLDAGLGLNFNLSYTAQRLRRDGGIAFEVGALDTRVSWQLDPRQRLRLSLQGSAVDRDAALYARPVARRSRDLAAQLL